MTVARFAVSFDEDLARQVRRAAGDQPTSTWLADAAERKLRSLGLLKTVREWESQHGEITDAELKAVRKSHQKRARK
jgi:hypothetical protein